MMSKLDWHSLIAGIGILVSAASAMARVLGADPHLTGVFGVLGMACFLGSTTLGIRAIKDSLARVDDLARAVGGPTKRLDKVQAMQRMATLLGTAQQHVRQLAPSVGVQRPEAQRETFENATNAVCARGVRFSYLGNFVDPQRRQRVRRLRANGVSSEIFDAKHVEFPAQFEAAAISLLIVDETEAVFVIPRSGAHKSFFSTTNADLITALSGYFDRIWDTAAPWSESSPR